MSNKGVKNLRPHYDRRKRMWRVDFEDRDSEEGNLLYVAGEFAKTGLYFPYNDSETKGREYPGGSIKDIAPTVAKLLEVTPPKEWEGKPMIR